MSRAFIVEDEALVAMMLEDMLEALGHDVAASIGQFDRALQAAGNDPFDFAVLDINLDGKSSLPIADALQERGIPFIFTTGYGSHGLEGRFPGVPVLTKPYIQAELEQAIDALFSRAD